MPIAGCSSSEEEARAIAPEFKVKLKAISVKLEESAFRKFKPAELRDHAFGFCVVFPGFFQSLLQSLKIETFQLLTKAV